MTTAIAIVVDASLVTAMALLVCRALRRRSAALRHTVFAAALAAVAVVPVLETTVPHWDVPVLSGTSTVTTSGPTLSSDLTVTAATDESEVLDSPGLTWSLTLLVLWSLGFIAVMAGLIVGLVRLVVTTRGCQPVQSNTWRARAELLSREHGLTRPVVVLECPDRSLLLTWGLFRPRIIVPTGARSWTTGRIDVVLAHELAHIVRRDWVTQIAAEIVRAVHWFNPLVWLASRRLRDESEHACDDAVLRRGLSAVDYASHLLAVARHVAANGRRWASAPAVADPSTLERRISAMLNISRTHAALTRTNGALMVLAAIALTVPVAAVTLTERFDFTPSVTNDLPDVALVPPPVTAPQVPVSAVPRPRRAPRAVAAAAQQKPGSISGTLVDSSGAVLPGVQLTLTDTAGGMKFPNVSDAGGRFIFRDLTPSRYELAARLPGFSSLMIELTLGSGEELQRRMEMKVGQLMETVTVTCPVGTAIVPLGVGAPVLAFERRGVAPPLFALTSAPGPALAAMAQAGPLQPIRVGGQIAVPRPVKRVPPVCPGNLPANGFLVILEATIGVDGLVKDVKVLRPKPGEQQDLVQPAIDALRQWESTPTRLNNVPIPVTMTLTVTYTRP